MASPGTRGQLLNWALLGYLVRIPAAPDYLRFSLRSLSETWPSQSKLGQPWAYKPPLDYGQEHERILNRIR
jgi:hypothetical protein